MSVTKRIATLGSIVVSIFLLGGCVAPPPGITTVYYFCRTVRCPSCEKIEALTKQTVERELAAGLATGRVRWQVINIDEPANEHFSKDYGLQAQSVVLSEHRGAKETRWKDLDKVWDLITDDAAFVRYIQSELHTFQNSSTP